MAQRKVKIGNVEYSHLHLALIGLGGAAGLIFAYQTKQRFWGYVGFLLAGKIIGGAVGFAIASPKRTEIAGETIAQAAQQEWTAEQKMDKIKELEFKIQTAEMGGATDEAQRLRAQLQQLKDQWAM